MSIALSQTKPRNMETRSIAKNLIYQRKLKGYTQEELSVRTQVTVRTIQRIEKGDVTPHLQTVKLLATALEIGVDQLLPLKNPKEETVQKKWLILLHSTPFLGFIIPLANILFPLFLWIHKREDNGRYDAEGTKIINFQISMSLLYLLSLIALITVEKWGFFAFISVVPYSIIVMLFNIVRTVNSQKTYYPLSLPFLRSKKRTSHLNLVLTILSSTLLLTACGRSEEKGIARLDGTAINTDSLTNAIKRLTELGKVHGMAVSIFNENEVRYQKTFGYKDHTAKLPLNDSTNVYGGSFSKAVFGVLVMKLVEDGIIDLDTPLESYLPKKIYEYEPETRWHDDFSALKNDSLYHSDHRTDVFGTYHRFPKLEVDGT